MSVPSYDLLDYYSRLPPGKTKDEESVRGSISIPEVAHDTEEDEYVVRSLSHSHACPLLRLERSVDQLCVIPFFWGVGMFV